MSKDGLLYRTILTFHFSRGQKDRRRRLQRSGPSLLKKIRETPTGLPFELRLTSTTVGVDQATVGREHVNGVTDGEAHVSPACPLLDRARQITAPHAPSRRLGPVIGVRSTGIPPSADSASERRYRRVRRVPRRRRLSPHFRASAIILSRPSASETSGDQSRSSRSLPTSP